MLTNQAKHVACLISAPFLGQPARAARNTEKHQQEKHGGNSGNSELPTALRCTKTQSADHIVEEIRKKNSEHDIELEEADETAAPFCRRDFGNVHRAKNGGAADSQTADKPECDERRPIPSKGAP